jgi:hypothetical protein
MCKDSPNNGSVRRQRKYSPKDGPHRPKHVVSEWKEIIIKNFVATDSHYNKSLVSVTPKRNSDFVFNFFI